MTLRRLALLAALLTLPASVHAQSARAVSWPAVAGADSYRITVDGGAPTTQTATSVTLSLTDGTHSVKVEACAAGQCSPCAPISIVVATTPPPVPIDRKSVV